jgi:hypothetical protein
MAYASAQHGSSNPLVLLILVAIFVAIGVAAFMTNRRRGRGNPGLERFAVEHGWTYSLHDPGNILALGFRFFRWEDKPPIVADVVVGADTSGPFQCFTLRRRGRQVIDNTGIVVSPEINFFQCVAVPLAANCAPLSIHRTLGEARLMDHSGGGELKFEDDAFNHLFRVHCDDTRFAYSMIDERLMEWLREEPYQFTNIELAGSALLVASAMVGTMPSIYTELIDFAGRLRQHIPAVVYSTYPATQTSH